MKALQEKDYAGFKISKSASFDWELENLTFRFDLTRTYVESTPNNVIATKGSNLKPRRFLKMRKS